MGRRACKISYEGTNYAGYQVQPQKRTIQAALEQALTEVHKGMHIPVVASGRTDAGVHAYGQVIHFDTPLALPDEKWPYALNPKLPADIQVEEVKTVPDTFHARYDTVAKEYRYMVMCGARPNIFRRHQAVHIRERLDVPAMQTAARHLLGTHDFSSFCAANTNISHKVRTITHACVQPQGDELVFIARGDGFLYNMVRIIVGTLLEVGVGKRHADDLKQIIVAEDREQAGKTAPAHGLYLWQVDYEESLFTFDRREGC
ncbi:tRNA pseudouridine(38-40) synthase TruA [Shouchella lonarensis]|uniref:tRNA pseudouridine synthase A n=1 Tax=Shouchella lonarensis TaxID=1464122 RepID=A0A1G6M5H3_9BACI|nr:tRNA pseudouridine(38-40) synthase TruA [Shouchella lonarensis]SDC50607.1 tRNA pseudouridine38-40 synthase [Shouchella lonarensis]